MSSLVEASLDYTDYDNWILGDVEEEMHQLLVPRLRHVKHLKLGMMLLEVLYRLEAEGFMIPLNIEHAVDDGPKAFQPLWILSMNSSTLLLSSSSCNSSLSSLTDKLQSYDTCSTFINTLVSDQNAVSLKAELKAILPELEEMKKRKTKRRNQFLEVLEQIQKIQLEIYETSYKTILDESDLSLRKLEELQAQLQTLEKEKSDRLEQLLDQMNTLSSLCLVLGMDFTQTIHEIQPGLAETEGTKSISNEVIGRLAAAIQRLREVKIERMQR
nr:65-kDa microtubule-associated protein 3-like [Tanacetum cinerariifolium]